MNRKQVTAALLAGTLLLAPTTAWAEANTPAEQSATDDFLSLPMQILDFDRDNLFFEYTLNNGLDFTKAGTLGQDGSTSGLVSNDLGTNGVPQYTDEAKGKIASLVAEAATETNHTDLEKDGSQKFGDVSTKIYDSTLTQKNDGTLNSAADGNSSIELQKWTGTSTNGENTTWTTDSKLMAYPSNKAAEDTLWGFAANTDHLAFYSNSTATVYQDFTVESGSTYICDWYANGEPEGKRYIGAVNVTLTMNDGSTIIPVTSSGQKIQIPAEVTSVRVALSPKTDDGKNDHQLWAFKFYKEGTANPENLFDAANQAAWTGPGHQVWHGEGDGAVCDDSSVTLTHNFTVIPGGKCQFYYWIGEAKQGADVYTKVTVSANGKEIGCDEESGSNYYTFTVEVPQGANSITVNIAANADVKVAIMNVTSYACRVGNDDANAAATAAAGWSSWNDMMADGQLSNARQYTEFVLNRLFVPTEGLNTKVDAYDHLILQKDEDGSYVFDSENQVKYDKNNHAIYNTNAKDEAGNPILSDGFFPVDDLGTEQITRVGDDETQPGHNFHFTLHSGGNFVYREAKNLFFDFSGDDDVYLFINGKLALDLGGAHQRAEKSIKLNEMVEQLGLQEGQTYSFDFFYMERHTTDSNLKINTNIDVRDRVAGNDKVYQKVTFVFDNLTTTPQNLYVQAYKDGQKMGYPQKYAPTNGTWGAEDLTSQWELPTGSDYRFELVNADGSTYTDEEATPTS